MQTTRARVEYKETVGRIVVLDYYKSILSKNFNPSKFDFNPWDLIEHLEEKEKYPNKTDKMREKNPGGPNNFFSVIYKSIVSGQQRGQIGMCSPDPNRGSAQLAARGQRAAGQPQGRRPAPKMGFYALSLAILGLAMSSMVVPLTSPALLPSVVGWDYRDPPQPDSVRCQRSLHCSYSGNQ